MKYLNLLETQLVQASRELYSATGEAAPRARTRLRTNVRRHATASIVVVLLTLTVASVAIGDAAGVLTLPAFWQENPAAPSPYGTTSSIPGSLASAFAILRGPREPTDALPATGQEAIAVGVSGQHYGVNLTLSRFAGTVDGQSLWLVPGNAGSCIYGSGEFGAICTANDLAVTQGIFGVLVPIDGGAVTIHGIVPDDATVTATNTDGIPAPVTRSGNLFSVSGDTNLRGVTVHNALGHAYNIPAPGRVTSPEKTQTEQGRRGPPALPSRTG